MTDTNEELALVLYDDGEVFTKHSRDPENNSHNVGGIDEALIPFESDSRLVALIRENALMLRDCADDSEYDYSNDDASGLSDFEASTSSMGNESEPNILLMNDDYDASSMGNYDRRKSSNDGAMVAWNPENKMIVAAGDEYREIQALENQLVLREDEADNAERRFILRGDSLYSDYRSYMSNSYFRRSEYNDIESAYDRGARSRLVDSDDETSFWGGMAGRDDPSGIVFDEDSYLVERNVYAYDARVHILNRDGDTVRHSLAGTEGSYGEVPNHGDPLFVFQDNQSLAESSLQGGSFGDGVDIREEESINSRIRFGYREQNFDFVREEEDDLSYITLQYGSDRDSGEDSSTNYSISEYSLTSDFFEEETEFEDEEDRAAFKGIRKHIYRNRILPLKNGMKITFNYDFAEDLTYQGRDRICHFLASATHLKQLLCYSGERGTLPEIFPRSPSCVSRSRSCIRNTLQLFDLTSNVVDVNADDNKDVDSKKNESEQHNLRKLYLLAESSNNTWGKINASSLKHYLEHAPFLKVLSMKNIPLELEDLCSLVSNFSGDKLNLSGSINGDAVAASFLSDERFPLTNLRTLGLGTNSLGQKTCQVLSELLVQDGCQLEFLDLYDNNIDDDCVNILVEALRSNESLNTLDLDRNDAITEMALKAFKKLVFDPSSFESVISSNHTLQILHVGSKLSDSDDLRDELESVLKYNWTLAFDSNEHVKIRLLEKLARYIMTPEGDLRCNLFLGMDVKVMPNVIEFIGRQQCPMLCCSSSPFRNECHRLNSLYQLVSQHEMPQLFTFPSREKSTLTRRVNQLECEKKELFEKICRLRLEKIVLSLLVFLLSAALALSLLTQK